MLEILSQNPVLTFFLVVAAGAALGQLKIGPLRIGAAGALFVGLALSAANPDLGAHMGILQSIGLALFVYAVGIGAGATFMSQLRAQTPLIVAAAVMAIVGAVVAVVGGRWFDLPRELATGLYTGALTSAPALDSALRISGSTEPGAGYAVGYPAGVVIGILIVTLVVGRAWPGENDTPSLAGTGLVARTARVLAPINIRHVAPWKEQRVRISYLRRRDITRVVVPGEDLQPGDRVVIVGTATAVEETIAIVGEESDIHLADDRRHVDFERITVSNPEVAGRTIAELNMPVKFGAVITRVRRGDLELLATDDLALQPGDTVAVAVPGEELQAVSDFMGNSERNVSEVDALALGLGLVLGMALGLVSLPLPGGTMFSLGAAAGPLVVGIILGALRRTGPLIWSMPQAATLTIRQLGLLFFLAALGLGAGPEFKAVVTTSVGWKAVLVSAAIVFFSAGALAVAGRILKLSAPRTAGGVAGFLGQPAILQAASARVADERIEASYAALFAASIVFKILLVPIIFSVLA